MDETDFHNLVSPKFKTQEDIKDDKILMVNEVVNVTMPIIDSTYVNHHLDKSLLMVKINFIHFYVQTSVSSSRNINVHFQGIFLGP